MRSGVREAVRGDLVRIIELYRQLNPQDSVLTDETAQATFDEIMENHWLHLFVLEDKGRVESTCYLSCTPNLTRSARPFGVIENVVTDEQFRGRGFGKRVVKHALDVAWGHSCYKVMLLTGSKKDTTHDFYRSCGLSGDKKRGYVMYYDTSEIQR